MWQIAVFNEQQHEQLRSVRARFTIARDGGGRWAFSSDEALPEGVALCMRIEADHLRLDCHGLSGHVELADGAAFWAGKVIQLALPCVFQIANTWFEVRDIEAGAAEGLEPLYRAPTRSRADAAPAGPDAETVARWLTSVGQLHRSGPVDARKHRSRRRHDPGASRWRVGDCRQRRAPAEVWRRVRRGGGRAHVRPS
jgi:hypothetical protein